MTVVQVWLLIGIPVLLAAITLFTARSQALHALGAVVALGGAAAVAAIDQASGAVLGVFGVLLFAAGSAGRGAVTGDDPVRGRGPEEPSSA